MKRTLDEMLQRRCVPIHGVITKESAANCIAQLLFLASTDPRKPVTLHIDSPGGIISDSIAIIKTIDKLTCPVGAFCCGDVGGTAVVITAHCYEGARLAKGNCRFSFATVTADVRQGYLDAELSQFSQALAEILAEDTHKHEAETLKWLRNSLELSAREAISLGILDTVSDEPLFPCKLKVGH